MAHGATAHLLLGDQQIAVTRAMPSVGGCTAFQCLSCMTMWVGAAEMNALKRNSSCWTAESSAQEKFLPKLESVQATPLLPTMDAKALIQAGNDAVRARQYEKALAYVRSAFELVPALRSNPQIQRMVAQTETAMAKQQVRRCCTPSPLCTTPQRSVSRFLARPAPCARFTHINRGGVRR